MPPTINKLLANFKLIAWSLANLSALIGHISSSQWVIISNHVTFEGFRGNFGSAIFFDWARVWKAWLEFVLICVFFVVMSYFTEIFANSGAFGNPLNFPISIATGKRICEKHGASYWLSITNAWCINVDFNVCGSNAKTGVFATAKQTVAGDQPGTRISLITFYLEKIFCSLLSK